MLKLRDDTIAWREVDGETLLLDLATATYVSANASATVLWQMLGEGTTREALVAALTKTYGIGEDQAASDVDDFLRDCEERGYLDERDE